MAAALGEPRTCGNHATRASSGYDQFALKRVIIRTGCLSVRQIYIAKGITMEIIQKLFSRFRKTRGTDTVGQAGVKTSTRAFTPDQIWIQISSRCNLHCAMCHHHSANAFKQKIGEDMSCELFRKIVDQSKAWHPSYTIQLDGEPLMNPHFLELLAYARENSPASTTSFYTNGTLMTPEFSDRLVKIGCDEVFFSIDAHSEEAYSKIRLGGNFKKVIENIHYLVSVADKSPVPMKIGLAFVIQEANQNEQQAFLKEWKDEVDIIRFLARSDFNLKMEQFFQPKETTCPYADNKIAVLVDGNVVPCATMINRGFFYGNLHYQTLDEMLSTCYARDIVAHINSNAIDSIPVCNTCTQRGANEYRSEIVDGMVVCTSPIAKFIITGANEKKYAPDTVVDLKTPFEKAGGFAWKVDLHEYTDMADDSEHQQRSQLLVLEDGQPVALRHSLHDHVRTIGRGTYSHWTSYLLFSTTDNTDPNTNGRRYQIAFSSR